MDFGDGDRGRSRKRIDADGLQSDDCISALPDSLLVHILSFLDMKHAVLTGILSSRWRDIWTSLPVLNFQNYYLDNSPVPTIELPDGFEDHINVEFPNGFEQLLYLVDDGDDDGDVAGRFMYFVERSLVLHVGSNVQKLRLCFRFNRRHGYGFCVDAWIRFAVRRGVQELDLDFFGNARFGGDPSYKLPSWFFKNQRLVSLKLKFCIIVIPNFLHFSSLRALSLSKIPLTDGMIQQLLAGCPLLEDFAIIQCDFMNAVSISSSCSSSICRLKSLKLEWCYSSFGFVLQAPNLEILDVSDMVHNDKYSLKDMFSLREAHLDLDFDFDVQSFVPHQLLLSLLEDLRRARVLSLSSLCIQVMSVPALRDFHSYIPNTKCLTLETGLAKSELPGIAKLLRCSRDLETLIIKLSPRLYFAESMSKYDFDERQYWDSLMFSFPCLANHLKTVKITGFMGVECSLPRMDVPSYIEKQQKNMKLVSFLLNNAMVLEKMTIQFSERPHCVSMQEWQGVIQMVTRKILEEGLFGYMEMMGNGIIPVKWPFYLSYLNLNLVFVLGLVVGASLVLFLS